MLGIKPARITRSSPGYEAALLNCIRRYKRTGDPGAVEELFSLIYPLVRHATRKALTQYYFHLHEPEEIELIILEDIYRSLRHFDERKLSKNGRLAAFFTAVIWKSILKIVRKEKQTNDAYLGEIIYIDGPYNDEETRMWQEVVGTNETELEDATEAIHLIENFLATQNKLWQRIFVLFVLHQKSPREISEALGIHPRTAQNAMTAMRKRLREFYKKWEDGEVKPLIPLSKVGQLIRSIERELGLEFSWEARFRGWTSV